MANVSVMGACASEGCTARVQQLCRQIPEVSV